MEVVSMFMRWIGVVLAVAGCSGAADAARGNGFARDAADAGSAEADAQTPEAAALDAIAVTPEGADGAVCVFSALPVGDDCVAFGGCGSTCGRAVQYYCATGTRPNAARCLEGGEAIGSMASVSCCDAAAVRATSYDGQCSVDHPGKGAAYAVPSDGYGSNVPMVPPPNGACVQDGHARGPFVASLIYCC